MIWAEEEAGGLPVTANTAKYHDDKSRSVTLGT